MKAPWDDIKIAFAVENDDAAWDLFDTFKHDHDIPKGWELVETDGAGCRSVAVFRVSVMPTIKDGKKIAALIKKYKI